MTKKALIIGAVLAAVVLALFFGLMVGARSGSKAAGKDENAEEAARAKFVPPLERLRQERMEEASGLETHSKMTPPKTKIFQTLYKGGTQVTFNHEAHVGGYGLGCIECHHVERCSRCHAMNQARTVHITTGKQALHENCIVCHSETGGPQKCEECHKQ